MKTIKRCIGIIPFLVLGMVGVGFAGNDTTQHRFEKLKEKPLFKSTIGVGGIGSGSVGLEEGGLIDRPTTGGGGTGGGGGNPVAPHIGHPSQPHKQFNIEKMDNIERAIQQTH